MKATKRYELRGFCRNARGKYRRVKTLTIREDDPHAMAVELWRLTHTVAPGWRYEVADLAQGKGPLAPLVTYEELVRRSQAPARQG